VARLAVSAGYDVVLSNSRAADARRSGGGVGTARAGRLARPRPRQRATALPTS